MRARAQRAHKLGHRTILDIMIITTASNITDTGLINWNLFLAMVSFTEHHLILK
jgi:hypothetical protein